MELLLESRDGEITALNEQVLRLGQRNRVLESALGELQERIRGLESGLGRKEVEVLGLEGRLGKKEEEASALAAKNKSFREQIDGLCEAVTGLERQRDLWVAKEATLVGEIQRLGFVVQEKNGALSDAVADAAKNKEMCRSIEAAIEQRIRAKDLELDAAKKEIEVKDSELVRYNDDVLELREKSRGMQATIDRLEDTVAGQSKRLTSKEAEATGLEAKICVLQAKLGESEEEIESLARSRKGLIEQNELLKQTVQKFEERRADWIKREESLTREVQELAISLEEKCSSVNAAVKEVKDEKDRCKSLGSCLTEKVEELKCSRKKCEDLETSLEICEGELTLLQDENNRQQKALKLAAAESRIESLTARLKEKTEELEALTVDSRVKDETLAALTEEAESLRRENKKIGSAAQRLQKAMESRSAEAAEQMQDLSGKIAQLQNDLHDKIEDLRIIQGENEELQQEAQRFRVCLEEFEIRKNNWEQKEHDLTDRVSEMSSTIEDRAAALASAGIEIEHLKNKCRDLEEALEKEVDRLKLCMEERHRFESGLNSSLQEIEKMRAAAALEAERFEQKLSVSESRLKDAIGRMNLKADELEIMSKNLEEKDAQLGCISDELRQIREVKVGLDAAAEASRTSIEALEALLKTKQAELSSIDEKLANVESKLCEREESLESAARENVDAQKQIAALMQAVAELEEKRDCSKRNQDDLARELRELELELENKCSALNRSELDAKVAKETCEAMQTSIETLEITLKKTIEELDSCIAERQLLGISLASCEQKLADLQIERDQVENLKEALIAVEYQLKESIGQLQAKSGEIELVVKDLRNKETQLTSAREDLQQLTEKNSLLDFSVQTLQVKVSTIAEELKRSEARGAQLFGDLTTAESKLAESRETISSLQLKVDLGNQISAKMEGASCKIKELESMLAELMAFAQDKDERLDASEWAVQQLGLVEVSKARSNLERAERERVQLKNRCAELEDELKLKEEELCDMEGCLSHAKMERDRDASSIECFRAEKRRLETEIEQLERELEGSLEDASITSSKLKEIQNELQRTQLSGKCLVQQMLMLHENLLEDGKALLDIGKKDDASPVGGSVRSTRRSSLSSSKDFDASLRCESMDFDGKENIPGLGLSAAIKSFDTAATKKIDAAANPVERAPFQVLDLELNE